MDSIHSAPPCKRDALPTELSAPLRDIAANTGFPASCKSPVRGTAREQAEPRGPTSPGIVPDRSRLRIAPITGKAACAWIAATHRHLPKLQGALFAVAVHEGGGLVGAGTVGNPPRVWQGTGRMVISRVAVLEDLPMIGDHASPACSMIYGALCRAGKALGYREAWTYTLPEEPGTSLRAAGFTDMGLTKGGEWSRPSRHREAAVRSEPKRRWLRILSKEPVA